MIRKTAFLIIAVLIAVVFVFTFHKKEERLTTQQIEDLRVQYPMYGDINKVSPLIEMAVVKTTLEEILKRTDTFVYGEVIEEVPVYSAYSYAKFYGYKIKIYEDTARKFSAGEEITIIANTQFKEYNPKLTPKMKIVIPVYKSRSQQGKYGFDICMYYVTEDGFVLSAFEEKEILGKEYSGLKVEKLLEEIKKPL